MSLSQRFASGQRPSRFRVFAGVALALALSLGFIVAPAPDAAMAASALTISGHVDTQVRGSAPAAIPVGVEFDVNLYAADASIRWDETPVRTVRVRGGESGNYSFAGLSRGTVYRVGVAAVVTNGIRYHDEFWPRKGSMKAAEVLYPPGGNAALSNLNFSMIARNSAANLTGRVTNQANVPLGIPIEVTLYDVQDTSLGDEAMGAIERVTTVN
ncbi:hypothetical protein, partial [Glaciibacter psychrotolerans]